MTKILMAHLGEACAAPPLLALSQGVQSAGAHYQKQFGPLPDGLLGDVLFFMGACVVLAGLAGWLVMGETRGGGRGRTVDDQTRELEVQRRQQAARRRRARRRK